jgi:hypothetical protein
MFDYRRINHLNLLIKPSWAQGSGLILLPLAVLAAWEDAAQFHGSAKNCRSIEFPPVTTNMWIRGKSGRCSFSEFK